jgi:hypothetical protein
MQLPEHITILRHFILSPFGLKPFLECAHLFRAELMSSTMAGRLHTKPRLKADPCLGTKEDDGDDAAEVIMVVPLYARSSKQIADAYLERLEKLRRLQQQTRKIKLLRRNRWLKRHRRWLKTRGNTTALPAVQKVAEGIFSQSFSAWRALHTVQPHSSAWVQQQLAAMRRTATEEREAMMERALISKTEGWNNPSSPGSSEEGSYHDESLPAVTGSSSSKDGQPADAS